MNTFSKTKNHMVIKSVFRDSIGKIALTMENGDVAFLHPNALEEAVGYELNPNTVRLLAGGTCYYNTSSVVAGEEFTWTGNPDDEVMTAESDLTIHNVVSLIFIGLNGNRGQYFAENLKGKSSAESYNVAKKTKKGVIVEPEPEEGYIDTPEDLLQLIDRINDTTKLKDLKAIAGEVDVFAEQLDELLKITTIDGMKQEMLAVISD